MKFIVQRFQRLCDVQPDLDILFVKLTAQIGIDYIRKTPSAQYETEVGDFMQSLSFFVVS